MSAEETLVCLKSLLTFDDIRKLYDLTCTDCRNSYHDGYTYRCRACSLCQSIEEGRLERNMCQGHSFSKSACVKITINPYCTKNQHAIKVMKLLNIELNGAPSNGWTDDDFNSYYKTLHEMSELERKTFARDYFPICNGWFTRSAGDFISRTKAQGMGYELGEALKLYTSTKVGSH